MEAISLIWDFAPAIKIKLIYLALVAQVLITIYCYTRMSKARVAASKAKRVTVDDYKATGDEPEDLRVFTRLVANQFEMPVLFYAIVLAALSAATTSWITVILAWAYVGLRLVHAREMLGEHRVLLRRKVFVRSTQVFLLLVLEFVIALLFIAGV